MKKLRISLNIKRVDGPYGGGNQFAINLEHYLCLQGHQLFRRLCKELDVILICAAQNNLRVTAYDLCSIKRYRFLNPNTIVVQRVNTCDEPRGNDLGINRAVFKANAISDYTVFVSYFIQDLFLKKGLDVENHCCVIHNGANEELFNPDGGAQWNGQEKFKLVTHHWSVNYLKGFDIYERFDQLLDNPTFRDRFEFTFIGNLPVGFAFKNTRYIPPLYGEELARELKRHHGYLTAARHEPGGNHYIEAMRCGLPVLYLRSGSLPEYCAPYGIEFTLVNFEEKLLELRSKYTELKERTRNCPFKSSVMASQYEALFLDLTRKRKENPRSSPSWQSQMKYYARFLARTLLRTARRSFTRPNSSWR